MILTDSCSSDFTIYISELLHTTTDCPGMILEALDCLFRVFSVNVEGRMINSGIEGRAVRRAMKVMRELPLPFLFTQPECVRSQPSKSSLS